MNQIEMKRSSILDVQLSFFLERSILRSAMCNVSDDEVVISIVNVLQSSGQNESICPLHSRKPHVRRNEYHHQVLTHPLQGHKGSRYSVLPGGLPSSASRKSDVRRYHVILPEQPCLTTEVTDDLNSTTPRLSEDRSIGLVGLFPYAIHLGGLNITRLT